MTLPVYATRDDFYKYGVPQEIVADVSTSVIDDILATTSRLADSYLSARYELPLSQWGADLTMQLCEIAAFKLLVALKLLAPQTNDYQVWRDRYDSAMRWLENVGQGRVVPTQIVSADATLDGVIIVEYDESRGW